jgi:hypothetical protein
VRISRDQLYEEVWNESMTTVAKRYDVSSNFLARVCERMNVPRPTRGYWAQVKARVKLAKPDLPEPRAGDEVEWSRDGCAPKVHMPSPDVARATRRKKRERPARHPLLVGAREHFDAARVSREDYLKPYKRNIVDVFVTKATIQRTLDFANKLFLSVEDRGHRVLFQPPDARYDRAALHIWDEGKSRNYYDRVRNALGRGAQKTRKERPSERTSVGRSV